MKIRFHDVPGKIEEEGSLKNNIKLVSLKKDVIFEGII